jgi:hypothetical protein
VPSKIVIIVYDDHDLQLVGFESRSAGALRMSILQLLLAHARHDPIRLIGIVIGPSGPLHPLRY